MLFIFQYFLNAADASAASAAKSQNVGKRLLKPYFYLFCISANGIDTNAIILHGSITFIRQHIHHRRLSICNNCFGIW